MSEHARTKQTDAMSTAPLLEIENLHVEVRRRRVVTGEDPLDLLVGVFHGGGEKSPEPEGLAFRLGKSRGFIERRVAEQVDSALVGLHGVAGQGLHPQIGLGNHVDITDAAIDHQPFPTVFRGFLGDHVAQQCTPQ